MAENDLAVLNAAVGYVFFAATGTAAPTPAEVKTLDPASYGNQIQNVKITGSPTGGTFTLTVNSVATTALPYNAPAAAVAAALAGLSSVGTGNVMVTGTAVNDATGLNVQWIGAKSGVAQTITSSATLTGGTSPAVSITSTQSVNGWKSVGHTSEGKLPEFGFDGGKADMKGSWQKRKLRKIHSEYPVDYVTAVLHQFDKNTLELYYGPNMSSTSGVYGVETAQPVLEKAGFILIVDGSTRVGFHFHKAAVERDEKIDLPKDDLAAFPIKAEFLDYGDEVLFSWISSDLLA